MIVDTGWKQDKVWYGCLPETCCIFGICDVFMRVGDDCNVPFNNKTTSSFICLVLFINSMCQVARVLLNDMWWCFEFISLSIILIGCWDLLVLVLAWQRESEEQDYTVYYIMVSFHLSEKAWDWQKRNQDMAHIYFAWWQRFLLQSFFYFFSIFKTNQNKTF
jgi:hypothetical protein